jgi:SAM-dependent methyltransferase
MSDGPRLYRELALWWPLLSPPEEYREEATFYRELLEAACTTKPQTLLELGSGGGSNASHLKRRFTLTLVDRSEEMLAVSAALNPECEHVQGDMREVRLGRSFDAVFLHDALCYLTDEPSLAAAIETAFVHCAPGGAALFVPDYVRERFVETTDCGGRDGPERGLRYLEWVWDPDPGDTQYLVDFAYLLREPDGSVRVEQDRHVEGIFPRATWLRLLAEAGFEPRTLPWEIPEAGPGAEVFVGVRPR